MTSGQWEKADNRNESNSDSSEISTIWIFLQKQKAFSHIFVTLDGIKTSFIFVGENAYDSIVCKLEFVAIRSFYNIS